MSDSRTPKIIAVAGGKGGVGKAIFSSMLGMCLAGFKRRTVLVDLDSSGANLHGYLQLANTEKSLNSYFAGRSATLSEMVQHTSFDMLDAITLQSDFFDADSCKPWQKRRLFNDISRLKADYVILDLGAASSNLGLDSFLRADHGIILTTSDMFSVVNTYSFIRSALLHSIKRRFYDAPEVLLMLDECGLLVDGKMIKSLDRVISQFDYKTQQKFSELKQLWQNFRPKVVLNFAQQHDVVDDFNLLGTVVKDLLNVELDYWGHIRFDPELRAAARSQSPSALLKSSGRASEDIVKLVVRHFIAAEIGAVDFTPQRHDKNIVSLSDDENSTLCHSKCVLWNNCTNRTEGHVCSKMSLEYMKKTG